MEMFTFAVPLAGEELAQQIRDGKAIFSTRLGTFPPREARPHEAPIIMRSDPEQDIQEMISRLRREYPQECRLITAPIKNLFDYFDHYDVQLHGTGIIHAVLLGIATHNARRESNIATFAESWKHCCGDKFWAITPETEDLFTSQDVEKYGSDFLDDAIVYLKKARMAIKPMVPPFSSGFVPSAVVSPTLFDDPAIIASQVSSRHSSAQSSTSSMALKDSALGQRHVSMHSEPESKILRSIRPSLLRNSSNPEGVETPAPSLTDPVKVRSVEVRSNENIAVTSSTVPSAIHLPKATFAQKIYAASSSQVASTMASQYPVQQGRNGPYVGHFQNMQNSGAGYRGFTEVGNSRPHGSLVETTQVSQGPLPVRSNGLQTVRHFDRQKMGTREAASRRLSGIAPPPPSHLIEPFPPFAPSAPPNQQIITSNVYGGTRSVVNSGLRGPSFEGRQYCGLGPAENMLVSTVQSQQTTNASYSLSNGNPPGSALAVPKTRNLQTQTNAPQVLPMDSFHGPPIAVQRPTTGQITIQSMPPHSQFVPFSNDARVMHDAQVAENQRMWQQQMQEQARRSETQSSNRPAENGRPVERVDRRFSHKRGRGGYSRYQASPTKHQTDQLDMHHRESGVSSHDGGGFPVPLPQQAVPESSPDYRGMTLQRNRTQSQRYTWKQYTSSTTTESPKAISSSDERPFKLPDQSSWHSPNFTQSSWNNAWIGSGNQWSNEELEPDKLYISGEGVTEKTIRELIEPLAKITDMSPGRRWKALNSRPFYFVSFATEEEARHVEAVLDGCDLPNHSERLRVRKARTSRIDTRRYPQHDRHSGNFQGSRAYPPSQFRNHSVPVEKIESWSQTSNVPSGIHSLADVKFLETPKARYQNSEPGNESANFNSGTVRRKKPSKNSVKPIAEENPAETYKYTKDPTKLESRESSSFAQADVAGVQRHSKGQAKVAKHGKKIPSSSGPIPKVAEQNSETPSGHIEHLESHSAIQKAQLRNQYSNRGRFDEPRIRPVSLGDYMHNSALDESPERSSDHSEQKPNDGSPTKKLRYQSGSVRSNPGLRKESFPALDSNHSMPSRKTQATVVPASSQPTRELPKSEGSESKPQCYRAATTKDKEPVNQATPPQENWTSSQSTTTTFNNSHPFAETSDSMATAVDSMTVRQQAEPKTPLKSSQDHAGGVDHYTSANPAVSALVSESWANELTSPEDFDNESAGALSKGSNYDTPNLPSSPNQHLGSNASQATNQTSSPKHSDNSESFNDRTGASAIAIVEQDSLRKHVTLDQPSIALKREPEVDTPTTTPLYGADEDISTVQPGMKIPSQPTVPPRKYHSHNTSKSEFSTSDAPEIPSYRKGKPKQNRKKKKPSNKAALTDYLNTESAHETGKGVEPIENVASVPMPPAIADPLSATPPSHSPQNTVPTGMSTSKAQDEPEHTGEIQMVLPHLDKLESMAEAPESLEASGWAPPQLAAVPPLGPSNISVPPRTSSIAPTVAPISTHKKKQKTPTKETVKKTKKSTTKKNSVATKVEIEPVAKSGDVVESKTQNESKVGLQESHPQPETGIVVSHLEAPEHEEIVDISDQCSRRPEYPSLDQTNAIYCVRGPTVVKKSEIPFFIFFFSNSLLGQADEVDQANTLKPTKDEVDTTRLKNLAQLTSGTEKGGQSREGVKEEELSDLGTPQLRSRSPSTLPRDSKVDVETEPPIASNNQSDSTKPRDELNGQPEPRKPKKKSHKKKKKGKTVAAIGDNPEVSTPNGAEEKFPVLNSGLPLMHSTEPAIQNVISKSDRFVADPESYAQEILSRMQGPTGPILKPIESDPFKDQSKEYYSKKYPRELAQNSLGIDPYSPHEPNGGSTSAERDVYSHSTAVQPTLSTTERQIELLNRAAFLQPSGKFHGLGITTNSSGNAEGVPDVMPTGKVMTHEAVECDELSDLSFTSLKPLTPRRPASAMSEIIHTPSDSTSPETVIAGISSTGIDIARTSRGSSEDKSPSAKMLIAEPNAVQSEMATDNGSKLPPIQPPTPRLNGEMNKSSTVASFSEMKPTIRGGDLMEKESSRGDMDSKGAGNLNEKGDDSEAFVSKTESDADSDSLFFSNERVSPKLKEKTFRLLATPPSEEENEDTAKSPAAFPVMSAKVDDDDDSKAVLTDVPQHQHAKDAAEQLKEEVASIESLATFVSEINFEIDPGDPIVQQFANFREPQLMPLESKKDGEAVDEEKIHNEAGQDALASDAVDRTGSLEGDDPEALESGKESVEDHVLDLTGCATRDSSDFSDVVDAEIVTALKSLPNGSPEGTVLKVVSQCMKRDLPEEDKIDEITEKTLMAGGPGSKSVNSQPIDTRPKKPLKKRSKKASGQSHNLAGSTPGAWADFAANVEKDEAAQREARQQDQAKCREENEKPDVSACELNLVAMNHTWRKIEIGKTGHRRLGDNSTTVDETTDQDMPSSNQNVQCTDTAVVEGEPDKITSESSAPTSEDDSEITLKPSESPDTPCEPVFEASIDTILAKNTLDTIPESVEFTKSKTPSVSPSRVAALRPSPRSRSATSKSTTANLEISFPVLPPPSVFALSTPSSPIQELSEDVIAKHNGIAATPQKRHRGSSSIHSEYSTTSSTPNTNLHSNSARRPYLPPKDPSWSNIAVSSGNSNVRLSPSRNPPAAMSPARNASARLSPTRRSTRCRADTRSSLGQSVTSRESEEEDTPRRGRSTTPAGGQKGVARRLGTAPKRENDDGNEWSVPPGEKMWGSSSEA